MGRCAVRWARQDKPMRTRTLASMPCWTAWRRSSARRWAMPSRTWPRLYAMGAAALRWRRPRERPSEVRRLLIVQHLLLGDTVMLTPLLKKARARYPRAEIAMAVPSAYAPLYDGKPY